ncbi:unnamed protein product [Rhizophagus irregularis]|nr:unnamed protein product [Rhizophagus irregularis]
MSNHRRACVTHQKKIFHQLHLKSLSLKNNNNNISPTNNKITHANNLFSAWNTLQEKRVYSKRLGIEYTFKYQANGSKNVLLHGNHFISSTRGRIICNVVENTSTIDDSATGSLSTVPETDTNLESSATSSFLTVNNFDPLPSTVTIPISTRAVAATQRTNSPSEGHLTAAPLVVMIKVHNYGETYPEAAPHPRYNLLSSRKKIENIPNFRVI